MDFAIGSHASNTLTLTTTDNCHKKMCWLTYRRTFGSSTGARCTSYSQFAQMPSAFVGRFAPSHCVLARRSWNITVLCNGGWIAAMAADVSGCAAGRGANQRLHFESCSSGMLINSSANSQREALRPRFAQTSGLRQALMGNCG